MAAWSLSPAHVTEPSPARPGTGSIPGPAVAVLVLGSAHRSRIEGQRLYDRVCAGLATATPGIVKKGRTMIVR
jgi:hypothetical protein